MITLFHAADLHLGLAYRDKSEAVKQALTNDRFNALQRMVDRANVEQVDFFVLAGDIFDTVNVNVRDTIQRAAGILGQFTGKAVLVLPGNHDFYERGENTLWSRFRQATAQFDQIYILHEPVVSSFEVGETQVNFFPGCCHSKHSPDHAIGWMADIPKDRNALNIGIAHGNVEGLALDEEGKYFNMTESDMQNTGLDFFLLGHVHVPFPTVNHVTTCPRFFMPGTTAQFKMGKKGVGTFWKIVLDGNKFQEATLETSSLIKQLSWLDRNVLTTQDADDLIHALEEVASSDCLLRLHVSGRMAQDEMATFRERVLAVGQGFLEFKFTDSLKLNIDSAFIEANYLPNSLGYQILKGLYEEDPNGMALQLAYDLLPPQEA